MKKCFVCIHFCPAECGRAGAAACENSHRHAAVRRATAELLVQRLVRHDGLVPVRVGTGLSLSPGVERMAPCCDGRVNLHIY